MQLRSRLIALLLAAPAAAAQMPAVLALPIACLALAPAALANTWIVDQHGGPGSHFTDLPAAIAAASAGDVLIVRPGTYSPYVLRKGLTILGDSLATTRIQYNSWSRIENLPAGELAIVAHVNHDHVQVTGCAGPVVLDHVNGAFTVWHCEDVRIASLINNIGGVSTYDSHVEIVSSSLKGYDGWNGEGEPGYPGLEVSGSGRVLLARTSARGGNGGSGTFYYPGYGGWGAAGVLVQDQSEVLIAGGGAAAIEGGVGGASGGGGGGPGGASSGLINWASGDWRSGAIFAGGWGCPPIQYVPGPGSFDIPVTPDDPTLELGGDPRPGASITLNTYAPPGTVVRLTLGGRPVVIPSPNIRVEQLTTRDRSVFLGVVPASGRISHVMDIPLNYQPGAKLFAQARVVDFSLGEVRRTNSVPIIVH